MKISHLDFLDILNRNEKGNIVNLFLNVQGIDVFCGRTNENYPAIYLKSSVFISMKHHMDIGKLSLDKLYDGHSTTPYLRIYLNDYNLDEFFAVFANALLSEIAASSADMIENTIIDYCEEWKLLFKEPQDKMRAVGLLGELYVLYRLCDSDVKNVAWNGAHFSPQDFSIDQTNLLEIKTTLNHSDYKVEVHGINQLDVANKFSLHIAFVRMVEVEDGEFSIKRLLELIPKEIIPKKALDTLSVISPRLMEMSFNCTEFSFYKVDDKFPKLTRSTIAQIPLNNKIENVSYSLNLQGLDCISYEEFLSIIKGGNQI